MAVSNPSPSYYAKTNAEQINAQQKAYAEALLEQNRAMKERIDALQKKDSTIQNPPRRSRAAEKGAGFRQTKQSAPPKSENPVERFFAMPDDCPNADEDGISDPGEIMLFPRSEADCQAFLVSQMRLNDELSAELDAFERRRVLSPFRPLLSILAVTSHSPPNNTP